MKYLHTFEDFNSSTLSKGAEIEHAKEKQEELEKDLYAEELKSEEEKEELEKEDKEDK